MRSGRCWKVKKIKLLTSTGGNWGRKDITWKMSDIIKMIFPNLRKVKIRKQTMRW